MTPSDMAVRRVVLFRKRWAGDITSDEQDELDGLTDALRLLAAQWYGERRRLVTEKVEA